MTQHTPGPWKAELMGSEGWSVYTTRFLTPEKRYSHTLVLADHLSEPDARLIAAAPELLEALQDCLGYLEVEDDDGEAGASPLAQAARAAIAKATQ